MSVSERWSVGNQTLCSLGQMLELAAKSKSSAVFTLRRPPPNHPHHHDWVNLTLDTVLRSGIPQRQVSLEGVMLTFDMLLEISFVLGLGLK